MARKTKTAILRKVLSVATFGAISDGESVPCGFCPIHIFIEHEAGGVVHYDEKTHKPICARCRILNGKMGSIIASDKHKRDEQVAAAEHNVQKQADEEALHVAEATQTATGTKRKH